MLMGVAMIEAAMISKINITYGFAVGVKFSCLRVGALSSLFCSQLCVEHQFKRPEPRPYPSVREYQETQRLHRWCFHISVSRSRSLSARL